MDQPFISFIITCKGRLAHLKEMLPGLVQEADSEVIVVDYDCPDGTAQWLKANHPQCVVVEVTGKPTFNASDARNHGLRQARGKWLFFLDADIVLSPGLVARVQAHLSELHFYVLGKYRDRGAYGSVLVAHEPVRSIGGWDSRYVGYGGEDYDFFRMLSYAGLSMKVLTHEPLRVIAHSKEERTRFHTVSKRQSLATGRLYGAAKRDLLKIKRSTTLPDDLLDQLRAECERTVRQAIDEGQASVSLTIHLQAEPALFAEELGHRPNLRRRLIIETDID